MAFKLIYIYICIYIYIIGAQLGGVGGGLLCLVLKIEKRALILSLFGLNFPYVYTRACSKKIRKCVGKLSKFIGMWKIDNRLIVSLKKNNKTLENIWYSETRVNTVSIYAPEIAPTNCNFYDWDIARQVYDVSCPKIAFFHNL